MHEKRIIAVWALAALVGLHVSAGLCQAGERGRGHSSPARPTAVGATGVNLAEVRKLAAELSARAKAVPSRSDKTANGLAGAGPADLHKLLSSVLAGTKGPGAKPPAGRTDPAQLQKLLSAALASPGGKGGPADAAGLQKILTAALMGSGGPGSKPGQGGPFDLAGLQKLLAGMLGNAAPAAGKPSQADQIPPAMRHVLLNRAQAALQGGNLGDARGILQRVVEGTSKDDPAFGAALRMAVRIETITKDLAARAERARRTGDHVGCARSLMQLSSVAGDAPEGRRARAWLASAGKDAALGAAVREARAQEIVAGLARAAYSARKDSSPGGVIVNDAGRRFDPLANDLAKVPPPERRRLLIAARRQLKQFADTPTGKHILGQLADLQAGKTPRRAASPAGRPKGSNNWRSLRID